jgi:hypothetical protein
MRLAGLLSALLVLCTGCAERSPDPVDFDGVPTCGAEALQDLLGKPEAALAALNLPSTARILRPGDAISLDFSPDRLTIDIDEIGRISSITCR